MVKQFGLEIRYFMATGARHVEALAFECEEAEVEEKALQTIEAKLDECGDRDGVLRKIQPEHGADWEFHPWHGIRKIEFAVFNKDSEARE